MKIISGRATQADNSQMTTIIILARRLVLLNDKGRHIAYHLSMAIAARVKTDTDMETV